MLLWLLRFRSNSYFTSTTMLHHVGIMPVLRLLLLQRFSLL